MFRFAEQNTSFVIYATVYLFFFRSNPVKSAEYTKVQGTSVEFKQNSKLTTEKQYVSILPVLIKSFGATFFFGSALKLIPDLMIFVSPQILE